MKKTTVLLLFLSYVLLAGHTSTSSYGASETSVNRTLNLSGQDFFTVENTIPNYVLNFSLTPEKTHSDQPFSIYINNHGDIKSPFVSHYRLTFTNYVDNDHPKNNGPKWRIAKNNPNTGVWNEMDFFPGSPVDLPLEQKTYDVSVLARHINPTGNQPLLYLAIKVNGLVITSLIDKTDPLLSGNIAFKANNAEIQVEDITIKPLPLKETITPSKVVVFGDSIAFGSDRSRQHTSSSVILQQLLGNGYEILNYGFPGEKVSTTLETKWHQGVLRLQQVIDTEKPEFIIIEEGTNNFNDPKLIDNLRAMVMYARREGVTPIITTLTPLYNGSILINVNEHIRTLAKEENIRLVDLWNLFSAPDACNEIPPSYQATSPRSLIDADAVHPTVAGAYKAGHAFNNTMQSLFENDYEAEWQGQTINGKTASGQISLLPGETTKVTVAMKNTGNLTWYKNGSKKIAFYVYRDAKWSWPQEYNSPQSPLFGTDFFASPSWGSSFDGKTAKAQAATLETETILPGEIAKFTFNLTVPTNAKPNSTWDNPQTPWDDTYYRSDFSLAAGPYWIHNKTNGDPYQIAHIWFGIHVNSTTTTKNSLAQNPTTNE
ncbi:MAG: SGNH/GDSL hydrolase family protein [bacterium]